MLENNSLAVIIPCFKVRDQILDVIRNIGNEIDAIYIIDDACPENTSDFVTKNFEDPRLKIIRHSENKGVGGAVITGYREALMDGHDMIIKIDGDGQMNPELIANFVNPIIYSEADYTKGNRFFNPEDVKNMPSTRLWGNAGLSFISKFSTGYWNIFDPTNGYTAIRADTLKSLPLQKIDHRYFFESDMLFRLSTINAVVHDVPMQAIYGEEISGLNPKKLVFSFLLNHTRNFLKRIYYKYYLRDFSLASCELPVGVGLFVSGVIHGFYHLIINAGSSTPMPAATVMFSALPVLMGLQLILAFLNYDIASTPKRSIYKMRTKF